MDRINIQLDNNNLTKMSNIFKSNSRFAGLVDDISPQKKENKKEKNIKNEDNDTKSENKEERFNSFKNDRPRDDGRWENRRESRFRQFDEKEREKYRLEREAELKAQKELEEREKERIKQESLKIENFPELVINIKKEDAPQKINYIEKIKTNNKINESENAKSDPDLANLKPGWCLLKRDPISRKTTIQYHPDTVEEPEKSEREIGLEIVNALVRLHQKRTEEYIELYGYDMWEKMFKFPDWREREAYLERMEEEAEEYDNYEEDDDEEEIY